MKATSRKVFAPALVIDVTVPVVFSMTDSTTLAGADLLSAASAWLDGARS